MKLKIKVKTERSSDPDYNPFACAEDILEQAKDQVRRHNIASGGRFKKSFKAPLYDCDNQEVGEIRFDPGIDDVEEGSPQRAAQRLLS